MQLKSITLIPKKNVQMVSLKMSESECCKTAEAVARRCPVKEMFLNVSKHSQKNTFVKVSFLIELETLSLQMYQKRDSDIFFLCALSQYL